MEGRELYDTIPGKAKYIEALNNSKELILTNYELMDLPTFCEEAIGYENVQDIGRRLMDAN